jgi:hypothetical protein
MVQFIKEINLISLSVIEELSCGKKRFSERV